MGLYSLYHLSDEKGRGYVGWEAFLGGLLSGRAWLFWGSLCVHIGLEQQQLVQQRKQYKQHSIG